MNDKLIPEAYVEPGDFHDIVVRTHEIPMIVRFDPGHHEFYSKEAGVVYELYMQKVDANLDERERKIFHLLLHSKLFRHDIATMRSLSLEHHRQILNPREYRMFVGTLDYLYGIQCSGGVKPFPGQIQ